MEIISLINILLLFYIIIFRLKVEHVGDYQLCFDNSFSYQARKVVFFEIFLLDENNNIEEDDILKYAQSNLNSEKSFQEYNMTVSQLQVFLNFLIYKNIFKYF